MDENTGRFKNFMVVAATSGSSDKVYFEIKYIEMRENNFIIGVKLINMDEGDSDSDVDTNLDNGEVIAPNIINPEVIEPVKINPVIIETDGRGVGLSTDNTEVLAWAIENPGFAVGIESLGSLDTIAPAVSKGNESLLNWINEEIKSLAAENFFHADYEATLRPVYGPNSDANSLVVEGGIFRGRYMQLRR